MKRIKANQIADGYLSEVVHNLFYGMDEGINPEYFIADEAQSEIDVCKEYIERMIAEKVKMEAEIAELVDMLEEVVEAEYLHQTMSERVIPKAKTLIAKHKKEE